MKAENLIFGETYKVLTYGIAPTWNNAKYSHHKAATETTNELFYFDGKLGCYAVLLNDLNKRVKESEVNKTN